MCNGFVPSSVLCPCGVTELHVQFQNDYAGSQIKKWRYFNYFELTQCKDNNISVKPE